MTEKNVSQEGMQTTSIQERREILLETTRELLEAGDHSALRLILNSQRPADLAELIPQLEEEQRPHIFEALAEPLAADVLTEMEIPEMLSITEDLDDEALSELVEEMAPDDAADVLGELPEDQSTKVLDLMEEDEADAVRELLAHEEDTGGGIMTSSLVEVREEMTVGDAIDYLREWADEDENFYYVYVVDEGKRLIGTVSLRRLILARPETEIKALIDRDLIAVRTDTDQEEIAQIFAEYNLPAVAVVDEEGRLAGRVTVDDIVEVIEEEATEDMYVMAATSSEEREERSVVGVARRRLPWLLICLAGTMLSGTVIDQFSGTISKMAVLMLFVPGIMAMGGNAGLQTTTVTVRSLATGQLQAGGMLKAIFRELRIAALMGMLLGSLVYGGTRMWTGQVMVGESVGLAMFTAVVLSAALGAVVPLFFKAIGVDPAVASGPLITTLNDAVSLSIYFTIATVLLGLWG